MATNKEWLDACKELLTEYEEDRHEPDVSTCVLCELAEYYKKASCGDCIWVRFTGENCGSMVRRVTNRKLVDEVWRQDSWKEFRKPHLRGWIERLEREPKQNVHMYRR